MTARPLPLRIVATGEYRPVACVDSTQYDRRWQRPDGWTLRHAGVGSRRVAGPDEPASLMAAEAATQALQRAGLQARDLDAVIVANSVGEQAIPCTAALVHRRLGLGDSGGAAFDSNATCLGFVVALDQAAMAIAAGRWQRVLIVAAEIPSAGLDPDDPDTAPLFGDGAAAAIVEAGDGSSALLSARLETWSDGADLCQVVSGGTRIRVHGDLDAYIAGARFRMSGKATYRMAAQRLPGFLERLFGAAGVRLDELAAFVPHQASAKALKHLELALGLPSAALVRVLEDRGNQMAASIPVALNHAIETGRVKRGDLVALVGSGAGLAFGGVVLRY
jgi:3-oxoacyl-[acyl-carrier-protein] synthase III